MVLTYSRKDICALDSWVSYRIKLPGTVFSSASEQKVKKQKISTYTHDNTLPKGRWYISISLTGREIDAKSMMGSYGVEKIDRALTPYHMGQLQTHRYECGSLDVPNGTLDLLTKKN